MKKYEEVTPDKKDRSKFDLDLEAGVKGEKLVLDFLQNKKLEVKSEQGKWSSTGNICIEFESYGRPSGIETTEADYWVQNLMVDGKHYATIIMPTDTLKEAIKTTSFSSVSGGDHNASRMWLLNLPKLFSKATVMKALGIWSPTKK